MVSLGTDSFVENLYYKNLYPPIQVYQPFTPVVEGTTTAGTATYSSQIGRYSKIGNVVTFFIRVVYSAGTGTGNLRVASLPFETSFPAIFTIIAENITLTAANYAVASSSASNFNISINQLPTGGGASTAVPYDGAGSLEISGSFFAA
jgi:hypothetical protein